MAYNYNSIPEIGALYDLVPAYAARLDTGFYVEEAARTTGRVLEIGCGTGRILLPIARARGTITGGRQRVGDARATAAQLVREPEPVRARVTLVDADVRELKIGGRFALVTAPFRVMQHMCTVDDQLAMLDAVSRHLAPNGRFIFDVFNPHFARLATDRSAEAVDTPEFTLPDGRVFRRTARIPRVRWVEQVSEVELIYYLTEASGGEPRRYVQAFDMRWYTKGGAGAPAGSGRVSPGGGARKLRPTPLLDDSPEQVWIVDEGVILSRQITQQVQKAQKQSATGAGAG